MLLLSFGEIGLSLNGLGLTLGPQPNYLSLIFSDPTIYLLFELNFNAYLLVLAESRYLFNSCNNHVSCVLGFAVFHLINKLN